MLTPAFELSQDDDFVVVLIKTPYVKVGILHVVEKFIVEFYIFCVNYVYSLSVEIVWNNSK